MVSELFLYLPRHFTLQQLHNMMIDAWCIWHGLVAAHLTLNDHVLGWTPKISTSSYSEMLCWFGFTQCTRKVLKRTPQIVVVHVSAGNGGFQSMGGKTPVNIPLPSSYRGYPHDCGKPHLLTFGKSLQVDQWIEEVEAGMLWSLDPRDPHFASRWCQTW